jgi:hypothetical protein
MQAGLPVKTGNPALFLGASRGSGPFEPDARALRTAYHPQSTCRPFVKLNVELVQNAPASRNQT